MESKEDNTQLEPEKDLRLYEVTVQAEIFGVWNSLLTTSTKIFVLSDTPEGASETALKHSKSLFPTILDNESMVATDIRLADNRTKN